jgi:hypothetical protein
MALCVFASCMVVLAAFPACNRDSGAERIDEERFVRIYSDMLYLAELHRLEPDACARAKDSLLLANGVDSSAVAHTMAWYAAHQEDLTRMYDQVIKRLEERSGRSAPASP